MAQPRRKAQRFCASYIAVNDFNSIFATFIAGVAFGICMRCLLAAANISGSSPPGALQCAFAHRQEAGEVLRMGGLKAEC